MKQKNTTLKKVIKVILCIAVVIVLLVSGLMVYRSTAYKVAADIVYMTAYPIGYADGVSGMPKATNIIGDITLPGGKPDGMWGSILWKRYHTHYSSYYWEGYEDGAAVRADANIITETSTELPVLTEEIVSQILSMDEVSRVLAGEKVTFTGEIYVDIDRDGYLDYINVKIDPHADTVNGDYVSVTINDVSRDFVQPYEGAYEVTTELVTYDGEHIAVVFNSKNITGEDVTDIIVLKENALYTVNVPGKVREFDVTAEELIVEIPTSEDGLALVEQAYCIEWSADGELKAVSVSSERNS